MKSIKLATLVALVSALAYTSSAFESYYKYRLNKDFVQNLF